MSSSKYRHRDTNRRLSGWVKGIMADTLISISRRRGSAPVLVNPAYTSQIDSRTGLLQGTRRGDRFCGLDGVVLDADTNAARNILQRMYDDEITLYTPYREVKRLLLDRSGTTDGTAHPGLEPARQLALPTTRWSSTGRACWPWPTRGPGPTAVCGSSSFHIFVPASVRDHVPGWITSTRSSDEVVARHGRGQLHIDGWRDPDPQRSRVPGDLINSIEVFEQQADA